MSQEQEPVFVPLDLAGRPPRAGIRALRDRLDFVLFLSPALLVLAIFLIYPAYYTIRLSFYESNFLFGFTNWVGIDNYKNLLTNDPDFLDLHTFPPSGALINNLRWVIVYITLSLALGLVFAVLAVRVRYERVVKSVVFVPMAISATAVGIIWLFVYTPDINTGVLNAAIHGFDHGFQPIAWTGRDSTVNYALMFAYIWASVGFVMVVLAAAIKGIPIEVLEAARVDGAGEW